METFISDTLEIRNNIGTIVKKHFENDCQSAFLVAPYFSYTDEFLDFSRIEKKINIICDANSGSCNPFTLERLIEYTNVEIRSRNDIHAKVYLLEDVAIITSANPTPNGLGIGKIEAGVLLNSNQSIKEIGEWFGKLWDDGNSEDIRKYDEKKWEQLKANWNLATLSEINKLPKLSDLIKAHRVPENVVFVFWSEIEDFPTKEVVEKQASTDELHLPKNLDEWNYWIEDEFDRGTIDSKGLEEILVTYRDMTSINIKTQKRDVVNFNRVYHTENFSSKLFHVPIVLKWKKKYLLLSLYRKVVNKEFQVDKLAIDMINNSLNDKKRVIIWDKYFKSKDGLYGYCSVKKLYELIE